jgi:hypothetical protein
VLNKRARQIIVWQRRATAVLGQRTAQAWPQWRRCVWNSGIYLDAIVRTAALHRYTITFARPWSLHMTARCHRPLCTFDIAEVLQAEMIAWHLRLAYARVRSRLAALQSSCCISTSTFFVSLPASQQFQRRDLTQPAPQRTFSRAIFRGWSSSCFWDTRRLSQT